MHKPSVNHLNDKTVFVVWVSFRRVLALVITLCCLLGLRRRPRQCSAVQKTVGWKKSCWEEGAMDAFSSSPSSGSPSQQFSASDFKDQLKTQLAQAYAEEFLEVFFFLSFRVFWFWVLRYLIRWLPLFMKAYVPLDKSWNLKRMKLCDLLIY